jgi:CRISPR-associated protein Csb1
MTTSKSQDVRTAEMPVTEKLLDAWATDSNGPVALHLKQKLLPVESVDGVDGIIYPPTYADIGYNIDTLSDGTKVALIDSVGSQANRMEPIFKAAFGSDPKEWLVPQIEIVLHTKELEEDPNEEAEKKKDKKSAKELYKEKRSILDLAHRSADAVVQSSPTLLGSVSRAFQALHRTGDAGPLCALAPTSLVFGVWDSRGGTGEKRPRLVRAVIRAWNVEPLHAAAQFNSISKSLTEDQREALKNEAKKQGKKLSEKGFADAPATFRPVSPKAAKYMHEFRDGSPNPERRVLGGVLARGGIVREVTVNLIALRAIRGKDPEETNHIRKYLLGLSLLAATADIDLFLREGCHLRYTGEDVWHSVPRRGEPSRVNVSSDVGRMLIQQYALTTVQHFKKQWPTILEHAFDLKEAKKLLAKKEDETIVEE